MYYLLSKLFTHLADQIGHEHARITLANHQRRSQDFCLGGGAPGRCHPVDFP